MNAIIGILLIFFLFSYIIQIAVVGMIISEGGELITKKEVLAALIPFIWVYYLVRWFYRLPWGSDQ